MQTKQRFEAGNINERKLYRASNHHKPSLDIMENQRDRTYINFLFRGEWIETENGVNRICRAGEDFRKLAEHRAFANKTPIEGVHLFKTAYNKENRHLIAPIPIPKEGLFSLDRLNSALQVFAPHLPQIPNGIGFWEYEALSENGRSSSQVHFAYIGAEREIRYGYFNRGYRTNNGQDWVSFFPMQDLSLNEQSTLCPIFTRLAGIELVPLIRVVTTINFWQLDNG